MKPLPSTQPRPSTQPCPPLSLSPHRPLLKALAAIKPCASAHEKNCKGEVEEGGKGRSRGGKGAKGGDTTDCFKLVQLVVSKGYDPLIVFAFGKSKCMSLAKQMDALHLNTAEESAMAEQIFKNAIETLTEDDQNLPQVDLLSDLLSDTFPHFLMHFLTNGVRPNILNALLAHCLTYSRRVT